ncbi:alpha/beta fold hydrolase [Thermaurantiacus sp.]
MTTPVARAVPLGLGTVHCLVWDADAPTLVFAHATGMCAAVYTELLAPLAGSFRIVAPDARGHGRTTLPADPVDIPVDWRTYREDLAALVATLGVGPVFLAGHSFGATMAFEAAVDHPGLARAVLLLDPAFVPFANARAFRAQRASGALRLNAMAEQARRRRPRFASRAEARAALVGRGVFAGWPEAAFDAYLAGGLLPDGNGVRLACTPAWEAASFTGVSTTLADSLARARLPFLLAAAETGSTVSADDEAHIRALHPHARVERLAGTGHFFPVTHPGRARPFLESLRRLG